MACRRTDLEEGDRHKVTQASFGGVMLLFDACATHSRQLCPTMACLHTAAPYRRHMQTLAADAWPASQLIRLLL